MSTPTILGSVLKPDGTPWAHAVLIFRLSPGTFTADAQRPGGDVRTVTDADGYFSVQLWANEAGETATAWICLLPDGESFSFTVPANSGTTLDLSALRLMGVTAAQSQHPTVMTYVDTVLDPKVAAASNSATAAAASADAAAASEAATAAAVAAHAGVTQGAHGIPDTSVLAVANADNAFTEPQTGAFRDKGGSGFDVTGYPGVDPTGTTNSASGFKAALAAADAVGGTMRIPAGTYLIQLGDPATDSRWTTISSVNNGANVTYGFLRITKSGTRISCDPGATIRVVATHIFQTTTDTEPTKVAHLIWFGSSTSTVTGARIEGGRWTWETGGTAALVAQSLGFNSWFAFGGYWTGSVFRDVEFDGFPRGGAELATIPGLPYGGHSNNLYDNVRVTNYGGAGGDNWLYCQGGVVVRGGLIRSQRTFQSHGVYIGLDRPGVVIDGVEFRDIRTTSKYPIDFRGTAGTAGHGPRVVACRFHDCNVLDIGAAPAGSTFKPYFGTKIIACLFDNSNFAGGGISFIRSRGAAVDGCTFRNANVVVGTECDGVDIGPTNDFQGTAQVRVQTSAANVTVRGRWMDPEAVPVLVSGTGRGVSVEAQVAINLADPKYTANGGSIAYPDAAMWIYPQGGTCDVRHCNVTLTGQTAASSFGLRFLPSTTNVNVHGCTFSSDSQTQGWAVLRVDGTATGPIHVTDCVEARPLNAGAPVAISSGGALISGGRVTMLNNTLACGLQSVAGLVRAEGNSFAGGGDTFSIAGASGAHTPNGGAYREIRYAQSGNVTVNAPTNPYSGARLRFVSTQDGTGGRTLTFDAVFRVNWTPVTTAGKRNVIEFVYDGASWNQVATATGL